MRENINSKDILLENLEIDKVLLLLLKEKNINSIVELINLSNKEILKIVNFDEKFFLEIISIINQEINLNKNKDLINQKLITIDHNLLRHIDEIEWTQRTYNVLKSEKIVYLGDLVEKKESYLMRCQNFGRKSLKEVKNILSQLNLSLGMNLGEEWPIKEIEKYRESLNLDKLDLNISIGVTNISQTIEEESLTDPNILIQNTLNTLNDKEKDIIIKRIGELLTLEEIGKIYGVTRERIRQIESKAIRKLKHKSRIYNFEKIININKEKIWDILSNEKQYIALTTFETFAYKKKLSFELNLSLDILGGAEEFLNKYYVKFQHGWLLEDQEINIDIINNGVIEIKEFINLSSLPLNITVLKDNISIEGIYFDICLDLISPEIYKNFILEHSGIKSKRAIEVYHHILNNYGNKFVDNNDLAKSCRIEFQNNLMGNIIGMRYLIHLFKSYTHLFYLSNNSTRIIIYDEVNFKQPIKQNFQKRETKSDLLENVKNIDSDIPKLGQGLNISYDERLNLIKKRYEKAYEPWSQIDTNTLQSQYKDGLDIIEISKKLKRQPTAIIAKLEKLNLIESENINETKDNDFETNEISSSDIPISNAAQTLIDIFIEKGPLRSVDLCKEYILRHNINSRVEHVYRIMAIILSQTEGITLLAPQYWGLKEHEEIFENQLITLKEEDIIYFTNSFCDERFCKNFILHKYGDSTNIYTAYNSVITEIVLNIWAKDNAEVNIQNSLLYLSQPNNWHQYLNDQMNFDYDYWINKKNSITVFNFKSPLGEIKLQHFEPDIHSLYKIFMFMNEHKFINYPIIDRFITKKNHNISNEKSHLIAAYLGFLTSLDIIEIKNDWMKKINISENFYDIFNKLNNYKSINENFNIEKIKENFMSIVSQNISNHNFKSKLFDSDLYLLL